MKPFNLEKALAGDEVVTVNGKKVSEIHLFKHMGRQSLCVIIDGDCYWYNKDGSYRIDGSPSDLDLRMMPKNKVYFINICQRDIDRGEIRDRNIFSTYIGSYSERGILGDWIQTVQFTVEE